MTRKGVFLAAVLAVASLGAVAQSNPSGTPASDRQNQISLQQNSNATNAQHPVTDPQMHAQNSTQSANDNTPSRNQNNVGAEEAALNNGQLPQTSTILPLLGLIGLGSLVAGFFFETLIFYAGPTDQHPQFVPCFDPVGNSATTLGHEKKTWKFKAAVQEVWPTQNHFGAAAGNGDRALYLRSRQLHLDVCGAEKTAS